MKFLKIPKNKIRGNRLKSRYRKSWNRSLGKHITCYPFVKWYGQDKIKHNKRAREILSIMEKSLSESLDRTGGIVIIS